MQKDTKELFRALITKICLEKKFPDIRFEPWFLGSTEHRLLTKIKERKNDLPSVEYLQQTVKFEPFDTNLTVTDIMELLNLEYAMQAGKRAYTEMHHAFQGEDVNIVEILDKVKSEAIKTRSIVCQTNTTLLEEDQEQLVDDYEKWMELKDPIPTGFDKLDAEAPLRRGEVVFIIGGTGGGKSQTAAFMATSNVLNDIPTSMFSLEMSRLQVLMRMIPMVTKGKYRHSDLKRGKVTKEEFKDVLKKYFTTNFNLITRRNAAPIKVSTIEAHLEEMKSKGEDKVPHILYVDYIGLLDQDKNWNAEESISGQLKRIALTYNVCIVVLVQADTSTMQRGDMPSITSSADNKGIVRDGDCVIGLLSEKQTNGKESILMIQYQVLKRRDDGGYIDWCMKVNVDKGVWIETEGTSLKATGTP